MPKINISVSEEFVDFVNREVASGEYSTASKVVRDALRLLRREKETEQETLAILRREISVGLADAQASRISRRTAIDIAAELDAEDGRGAV